MDGLLGCGKQFVFRDNIREKTLEEGKIFTYKHIQDDVWLPLQHENDENLEGYQLCHIENNNSNHQKSNDSLQIEDFDEFSPSFSKTSPILRSYNFNTNFNNEKIDNIEFLKSKSTSYNCNQSIIKLKLEENKEYNLSSCKNQYFSDTELLKMPLDFENFAMKNSFSLSSLQSSSRNSFEQSHNATELPHRPFNSLTRKLRLNNLDLRESRTNSWSNFKENHSDQFWSSLQSNYQYLMDSNLIECCTEAKRELNLSPSSDWSFEQLKEKFEELDAWLNSMKKAIYAKELSISDRYLKLTHIEEMQRKNYQKNIYLNQSSRLVKNYPELKEEISWRLTKLITKWDRLEQTVSPNRMIRKDCYTIGIDLKRELHLLRNWIKTIEEKLEPLNFRMNLSNVQLKEKARQHQIIQKDVESRGKTVSAIVDLCKGLSSRNTKKISDQENVVTESVGEDCNQIKEQKSSLLRIAEHWQHRWHLLCIRCIEWECHLENQLNQLDNQNLDNAYDSDDDRPRIKHPKLDFSSQSDSEESLTFKASNDWSDDNMTDISGISNLDYSVESFSADDTTGDIEMPQVTIQNASNKMTQRTNESKSAASILNVKLNDSFHAHMQSSSKQIWQEININDSAVFNKSNTTARNYGTYYYKHMDTDSEHEKRKRKNSNTDRPASILERRKSTDESSVSNGEDEEWTYSTPCGKDDSNTTAKIGSRISDDRQLIRNELPSTTDFTDERISIETGNLKLAASDEERIIQELVEKAEELVKDKSVSMRRGSNARSKHGKTMSASNTSTPTIRNSILVQKWLKKCHQDDEVVLRLKTIHRTQRPLSTSEIGHGSHLRLASQFSMSESAIHKMSPMKDMVTQDNLSSSTIEENTTQALESSGCSSNSLRTKKLKHRRRNTIGRKCHSGSADSLSALAIRHDMQNVSTRSPSKHQNSLRSPRHATKTVESYFDSFNNGVDGRGILSEPSGGGGNSGNHMSMNSSGTETEEDVTTKYEKRSSLLRKKLYASPAFRLGPTRGTVTQHDSVVIDNTSIEEHHSSFSWDSYQEKYMSEAYSEEGVDSEQVKQLLEFGDDYRKYMDSQSDCASSFSIRTKQFYKNSSLISTEESSPSDSDIEAEIRSSLCQSQSQLLYCEQLFAKQIASTRLILTESDFAKMKSACRENIRCLRVWLENLDGEYCSQQIKDIKALLEKWESGEEKIEDLEELCILQKEITNLLDHLRKIDYSMPNMVVNLEDRLNIEDNITIIKKELYNLKEKKQLVLKCNENVHKLTNKFPAYVATLKEDVKNLYLVWEETNQKLCKQRMELEHALSTWDHFEALLVDLQTALHNDQHALRMLDYALEHGSCSPEVAASIHDVFKVLSNKQDNTTKLFRTTNMMTSAEMIRCTSGSISGYSSMNMTNSSCSTSVCHIEGSLSDSGISDSGSEHDLSEREKRLANLKKLAAHLKSVLAPGSESLRRIMKRIEDTEEDIRELQEKCCTLISKTNASSGQDDIKNEIITLPTLKKSPMKDVTDSKAESPVKRKSMLMRVIRAALPFHMAVMVLVCIACLLEPRCCDSLNTFRSSFFPQLRYMSGPPPT